MHKPNRLIRVVVSILLALCVMTLGSAPGFARDKYETISASAFGTGIQTGGLVRVNFVIYEFSSDADRQILVDAFQKGQNNGLSSALQKMKAVGHIDVTGTIGYDVSFIRMIPTPTGRKIRFVTNRKI